MRMLLGVDELVTGQPPFVGDVADVRRHSAGRFDASLSRGGSTTAGSRDELVHGTCRGQLASLQIGRLAKCGKLTPRYYVRGYPGQRGNARAGRARAGPCTRSPYFTSYPSG